MGKTSRKALLLLLLLLLLLCLHHLNSSELSINNELFSRKNNTINVMQD
jgi:hypothetical protein